jgi:glycerol-3-phosphate cytidylyltransferase-like family protein
MNIDTINYCKNEDNKNRINNRLRALLTNPIYWVDNVVKRKIQDILQFLDRYTCRELLGQNINIKHVYDLLSQFLEESYLDEDTKNSTKRNRIDDFDINTAFNNLGLQNKNKNTQLLIDKINEIHTILFPNTNADTNIDDSFKKLKIGGSSRGRSIKKYKKNKKKTLKRKKIKTLKRKR